MHLRFKAVIEIHNINPYVLISKKRATALRAGWKKPMPVLVQINNQPTTPWKINMMPVGDGSFYLYLHGDVRKVSNTKVGDIVQVDVSFDDEYRGGPIHRMPEWFQKPLEANPKARNAWDLLAPSRQKEILRYFAGLKSREARERNVQKALLSLSGDESHFMGRDWKDGK